MKFLITVHDFRSVNGYTLAPRQVALGLKAKKHQVRFLCLHKPKTFFQGELPLEFFEVKPQNFIDNKKVKGFAPDVIITNGNSIVDIMALEYATSNKKFAISFVHSRYEKIIEQRYLPWGKYWPKKFINSLASALLGQFQSADIVIALSPEMQDYLKQHFPAEKLKVVGNGINLEQFPFKERRPQIDGYINLLYVANIEKRKNQIFLIEMMRFLPKNYILHLVGNKEEFAYYYKFKEVLDSYLKTANNIIYYGKVNHNNISKIYDMAHIFVDSSLMEAQSLVLLEAIASGIPIIRINNENTLGVTVHKKTAIHVNEPVTPAEFASKTKKLAQNSQLYKAISNEQRKVRSGFSREKVTADLVKIIDKSVKKKMCK